MLDFQRYQLEFTAHIRNPKKHRKPANVVEARMAVYRQAVLNNIFSTISVCFPVCQNVLGKRKWQRLMRGFLADFAANTPIFREIPQQFLSYLHAPAPEDLPPYLTALAHYEWIELAVSSKPADQPAPQPSYDSANLDAAIALAPSSELLKYDYPVHRISPRFKPTTIEETYLLVFRNAAFEIKFIVLNPVTFMLLSHIQTQQHQAQKMTIKKVLSQLATTLQYPDIAQFIHFGQEILNDLHRQQAITFR